MKKTSQKIKRSRRNGEQLLEAERIIDQLLDEGEKPSSIAALLSKKYNVEPRQIFKDVQKRKRIRSTSLSPDSFNEELSEIKHKANFIYRKAIRDGDHTTAIKTQNLILNTLQTYAKGGLNGSREESLTDSPTTQLEGTVRALEGDGKTSG